MKKLLLIVLLFISGVSFAQVSVQRFYNVSIAKHFYCLGFEVGPPDWTYEGGLGGSLISPTAQSGGTAVYRFYKTSTGAHYYSNVFSAPSGFVYEGVMGYQPPGQPTYNILSPVYEYTNRDGDFLYQLNQSNIPGYTYTRVAFVVKTGELIHP